MAKIEQIPFYFHKESRQYLTTENDLTCDDCKSSVGDVLFYYWTWGKVFSGNKKLCISCIGKQRNISEADETYQVMITNHIPIDATPVIIRPPGLTSRGGETVFSMAAKNRDGERVVDNTRLAGRIDYAHKAQVEQKISERELEFTDSNIQSEEEFSSLLSDSRIIRPGEEERELSPLEEQELLVRGRIEAKNVKTKG